MRKLIVNADDFGLSPGVNHGVIQAHDQGIVTAASLMVRGRSVAQAVAYANIRRDLSLGIHFDFGEWIYENDSWRPVYELVSSSDSRIVKQEAFAQLNIFRELVERDPTHFDSHQHFHRREPAHSVLIELSNTLGVPLREFSDISYCGSFYGQTKKGEQLSEHITPSALIRILEDLPDGVTELSCHPAAYADVQSAYSVERIIELDTLCDPKVRSALANLHIELCSF